MKEFDAVIFDLDDTLYPEIEYVRSGFWAVANYLSHTLKNFDSIEVYNKLSDFFNEYREKVFDRFVAMYCNNCESLKRDCVEIYRKHYPKITLSSDAEQLLKWIRSTGRKIGIISDGRPEGQWNKIKALNLDRYCDKIIITDELGGTEYRKPCIIPYLKMIDALSVDPQKMIYVGDNPEKDFVSANKLGIYTVMLINENALRKQYNVQSEYMPKCMIRTLKEIYTILT